MSEVEFLSLGLTAFTLAVLGTILSTILAIIEHTSKTKAEKVVQIEEALNEILDTVMIEVHCPDPEPVTNYRYNIHCPSCGKFSKRVLGLDTAVECKTHGVQVRWKDIPIDWATRPITDVEVITREVVSIPVSFATELTPLTEPIDIVVPDDISELEQVGAVI